MTTNITIADFPTGRFVRSVLGAGLGTVLALGPCSPAWSQGCAAQSPASCQTTNQYVNSGGYEKIRTFLGGEPGVSAKSTASQDMERVLDGPSLARVDLPGDLYLFSACQAHNCDDKGAVVVRHDGAIIGTGILHYPNYPSAVLTLFIRTATDRPSMEPILTDWAQSQFDAMHALENQEKQPISGVEVRILGLPR